MSRARIDETHDPARKSWVKSANGHSEFPVQNLPFGIFSPRGEKARPGVAIGDEILDIARLAHSFPGIVRRALAATRLNALFALSPVSRSELRRELSRLLSDERFAEAVRPALHRAEDCKMHLPAAIGDYTDFYVGIHHATNIGKLFRPDNPLLPNYKYVPIGYHGRASSVRPSGVPVVRPYGQQKPHGEEAPSFGPTQGLDYELELGVWVGQGNALGQPIDIDAADGHIAGYCLLNDWSARAMQSWEYQPLGPFLAKNFHTTISPWVVTREAMAPFHIPQPPRPEGDPAPLAYLSSREDQAAGALAVELEVFISTERMRKNGDAPYRLSRGPASNMYWTVAQMLTHHASNGCNLNPGDLLGTGTISAPEIEGFGSLMELTSGGKERVVLPNGEVRRFLEDGDELRLAAHAHAEGYVPIGFGDCRAIIHSAVAARRGG